MENCKGLKLKKEKRRMIKTFILDRIENPRGEIRFVNLCESSIPEKNSWPGNSNRFTVTWQVSPRRTRSFSNQMPVFVNQMFDSGQTNNIIDYPYFASGKRNVLLLKSDSKTLLLISYLDITRIRTLLEKWINLVQGNVAYNFLLKYVLFEITNY